MWSKLVRPIGEVSCRYESVRLATSLVPGEPEGPCVKTEVPGPKSKDLLCELKKIAGEDVDFTDVEKESCVINQPPGAPKLSILSFHGAFHGRTLGALSTTHSKHCRENKKEDEKCLAEVEELIEKYKKKDRPVAGVIIEPIQSEGGDHEASPEFFQCLQKICKKNGAALLIDEVQTGCGPTGKFWCHQHFNLECPPDVVTFSKKMQMGGYFHTEEMTPKQPYRVFNTWMGDPGKLILLENILYVIKTQKLLEQVERTGKRLKRGLIEIENEFPCIINSVRGRGTFLAVNTPKTELRDDILRRMKQKGVQSGGCGVSSIRLRPALVFQEHHADIFLDVFRQVLRETK
ncbi:hypothetical protein NQ314_008756 [Rhamnusium bicolor]|uniref:Uncharacterized protein n=1 Tax=Rhamnusium bicolor TaxID=1586634 RepID=A0AAV8Y7Y4_9CUCU|nr:hypothetical protein NQ314_008756 [Rhamnusium bicolor]